MATTSSLFQMVGTMSVALGVRCNSVIRYIYDTRFDWGECLYFLVERTEPTALLPTVNPVNLSHPVNS